MALVLPSFQAHPLFSPFHGSLLASPFLRRRSDSSSLAETADGYSFIVHVPGVPADRVTLRVTEDGRLRLSANAADGSAAFQRTLRLPEDADPTSATAWCADGVLRIGLRKLQPAPPNVLTVQPTEPPALDDPAAAYELRHNLPGLSAAEVEARVEEGELHVHARSSRGFGERRFSCTLPDDALAHGAAAFCTHGVLTVWLPRKQPPAPVDVAVATDSAALPEDTVPLARFHVPGYGADSVAVQRCPTHVTVRLEREGGGAAERHVALPANLRTGAAGLHAVCVDGVLTVGYSESALRQPEETAVEVASAEPSAPMEPQPTLDGALPATVEADAAAPAAEDWTEVDAMQQ